MVSMWQGGARMIRVGISGHEWLEMIKLLIGNFSVCGHKLSIFAAKTPLIVH